jgi:zinc transport system substrate-binding protein
MMRSSMHLAAIVAALAGGLVACGGGASGRGADGDGSGVNVVASFYPIAEVAEQVGGRGVAVTNLTNPGAEPHDLQLAPRQVVDLEEADVVLYVGGPFQPKVAEIARQRDDGSVDVLDQIKLEAGDASAIAAEEAGDEHDGGAQDPHFWLDPVRMTAVVDEVETALAEAAPERASTFRANAAAYERQLAALDREYRGGLGSCARHEIVTSHAAFFYLAERYGLRQLPIAGLSPDAEPSPARLARLARRIEADGITTVFYEALVSPRVARTLASEAHVTTAVLNPIEGLTKHQLEAGDDYVSVMRDNLTALRKALGCT